MKKLKMLFLLGFIIIITGCRIYNGSLYPSKSINFMTETGIVKKLHYSGSTFFPESSEHFEVTKVGFYYNENKKEWNLVFGFDIKNKNVDLEYVKVDAIIPNQSITLVEDNESMKQPLNDLGFTNHVEVKYGAKAKTIKTKVKMIINKKEIEMKDSWYAETNPKKASIETVESYGKVRCFYLMKFTIKAKGLKEEVIYQASALPIKLPYSQYEMR